LGGFHKRQNQEPATKPRNHNQETQPGNTTRKHNQETQPGIKPRNENTTSTRDKPKMTRLRMKRDPEDGRKKMFHTYMK
jgi:hypothetical protein